MEEEKVSHVTVSVFWEDKVEGVTCYGFWGLDGEWKGVTRYGFWGVGKDALAGFCNTIALAGFCNTIALAGFGGSD